YIMDQQMMYSDIRDQYPSLKDFDNHVEERGLSSGGITCMEKMPYSDIRNSQYGAAFHTTLVAKHVQLRLENDRKIESFTFCSSGYETIPTHDFMGYRTFDTKNGFHKPVLNAYKLLFRLAPDLIPVKMDAENKHITAFATSD